MKTKKAAKKSEKKQEEAGRPTKYRYEYCEQARKLCLLGATNEKLADFFNVAVSTISEWMNKNPAFSDAVKAGREVADATVAESLYKRANGFEHKATKMQLDRSGKWQTLEYKEVYPPDTEAAKFWLKNRQPDLWKDKREVEMSKGITVIVDGEEEE